MTSTLDRSSSYFQMAYEEGNNEYIQKNYVAAAMKYSEVIDIYSRSLQNDSNDELESLLVKSLLNRCQCNLQLREYEDAIKDCSSVLLKDGTNVKAYLRRAMAHEYLGDLPRAIRDATAAIDLSPPPSLRTVARDMIGRLKRMISKDAEVTEAEGVPDRLVGDHQSLRLNIIDHSHNTGSNPHQPLRIGEVVIFHLCIGNEFGLWNRRNAGLLKTSTSIAACPIGCELLILSLQEQRNHRHYHHQSHCPFSIVSNVSPTELDASGKFQISSKIEAAANCPIHNVIVCIKFSLKLADNADHPSVIPVISLPFDIHAIGDQGRTEHLESLSSSVSSYHDRLLSANKLQYSCIRSVDVGNDTHVLAFESPGFLGIGGKVWDSTYVLLHYLRQPHMLSYIKDKNVVELGSGTGIAGLGIAVLQPRSVILTDFPEVIPLIDSNIDLNRNHLTEQTRPQQPHYRAMSHIWGSDLSSAGLLGLDSPTCNIKLCQTIIASDVVYDPVGYEPLVKSLVSLLDRHQTIGESSFDIPDKICILAHRHRHPDDARFFELLHSQESLIVTQIVDYHYSTAVDGGGQLSDVEIYHICRI